MTHQKRKKASKSRLKQIEASKNDEDSIARVDAGQILIPSGPRLGHKVLSIKGVSKSFQDKNQRFVLDAIWTRYVARIKGYCSVSG